MTPFYIAEEIKFGSPVLIHGGLQPVQALPFCKRCEVAQHNPIQVESLKMHLIFELEK